MENESPGYRRCPNCQRIRPADEAVCAMCRAPKPFDKSTSTTQVTSTLMSSQSPPQTSIKCPGCGQHLTPNLNKFCPFCGHQFTAAQPKKEFCSYCGSKIIPTDTYCGECGAKTEYQKPLARQEYPVQNSTFTNTELSQSQAPQVPEHIQNNSCNTSLIASMWGLTFIVLIIQITASTQTPVQEGLIIVMYIIDLISIIISIILALSKNNTDKINGWIKISWQVLGFISGFSRAIIR